MTAPEYRMHTDLQPLVLAMQSRAVLAVHVEAALRISCVEGTLWVTQHRDIDDTVLEAGGSLDLRRRGPAVVQALKALRFVLAAAPARGKAARYSTSRRNSGNTFDTLAIR